MLHLMTFTGGCRAGYEKDIMHDMVLYNAALYSMQQSRQFRQPFEGGFVYNGNHDNRIYSAGPRQGTDAR